MRSCTAASVYLKILTCHQRAVRKMGQPPWSCCIAVFLHPNRPSLNTRMSQRRAVTVLKREITDNLVTVILSVNHCHTSQQAAASWTVNTHIHCDESETRPANCDDLAGLELSRNCHPTNNVSFRYLEHTAGGCPVIPSLPVFRQRLKTLLFHKSFPAVVSWQADYAFVDLVMAYCYFSHVKDFLIDWLIRHSLWCFRVFSIDCFE